MASMLMRSIHWEIIVDIDQQVQATARLARAIRTSTHPTYIISVLMAV